MSPLNDPYESVHFNMVHAHQTFKLGFDRILPLLDDPPKDDIYNFLGYCEAWADSIDGHHNSEELIVFPFLNQKLDFSGEIEAHKTIHAALDELLPFIRKAKAQPSTFDSIKMKQMMEHLREPLFNHLDEEIIHVAADNLRVFEAKDVQDMMDRLVAHAHGNDNPWIIAPYMLSHTAPEYKAEWPVMPWLLKRVVIPYILAMRYSGYWKYSPYGF